jgi:hypothetical protein
MFITSKLRSLSSRLKLVSSAFTVENREISGALRILRNEPHLFLDYEVISKPRYGHGRNGHEQLREMIEPSRERYGAFIEELYLVREQLAKIPYASTQNSALPNWDNPFFTSLDAMILYAILNLKKPLSFYEIGSGYSTRFARQAIVAANAKTTTLSIDPLPRSEVDSICDNCIREALENVDLSIFDSLRAGDVLFVDNSHRTFMNSDVTVFFMDILPRLKPGVLIGIHDIFLPYDYPPEWKERFYSEQYLLATYLLSRKKVEILFPTYFASQDPSLRAKLEPLFKIDPLTRIPLQGCSFWFYT